MIPLITFGATSRSLQALALLMVPSILAVPLVAQTSKVRGGAEITSVGPISPKAWQKIAIKGLRFGEGEPFNGCSDVIRVTDLTTGQVFGPPAPGQFCYASILVTSWTDTEIIIEGFPSFKRGQDVFNVGDILKIQVANFHQAGWVKSSDFRGAPVAWYSVRVTPEGTSPAAPAPSGTASTIEVPAGQPWTPTGIVLHPGDLVTLSAAGDIRVATDNRPSLTPDGIPPDCNTVVSRSAGYVAPQLPCWSLLGRIGKSGTVFEVGSFFRFTAKSSGELFLGVNDDNFSDNSGSWTVTVEVRPGSTKAFTAATLDTIPQTTQFTVGRAPYGLAFDGANIWVANGNDDTVTKLRASDGASLGTFSVGREPYGVTFDGANIWVANYGSGGGNTVTKLRASDGTNLGVFAVGDGPNGLAFDGTNIWVTNYGAAARGSTVTKLRASDGTNLGTFGAGPAPHTAAFDKASIWVTNTGTNWSGRTVTKLRASDGRNLGSFPVGTGPNDVVFDGTNLWVTNSSNNSVTKLRASDGAILGTFRVGTWPAGAAFDGVNIWVANEHGDSVTVLRASDGTNLGTFSVGNKPYSVAFDGANIWVTNSGSNTVSKLQIRFGGRQVEKQPTVASEQPPAARAKGASKGNIRSVDFQNFSYESNCSEKIDPGFGKVIPVTNGEWKKGSLEAGDSLAFSVVKVSYGDVKGDGQVEAIVHTACQPPANWDYEELSVFEMSGEAPRLLARLTPGEGLADHGPRYDVVRAERGELSISYQVTGEHGFGACPEWTVTERFRWNGSSFSSTGQSRKKNSCAQ